VQNEKVTIKIPRVLYAKIQQLITDSGFNSATDFIVYVLRDVLSDQAIRDNSGEFSQEELKVLKQKLRNLGYLD
jgi:Arc/MetJ-type ribon-helix-helix transcriptional regulator